MPSRYHLQPNSAFSFFFFGGLSIHLSQALLAHLFSYNITWGATKKEVERSNFFVRQLPNTRYVLCTHYRLRSKYLVSCAAFGLPSSSALARSPRLPFLLLMQCQRAGRSRVSTGPSSSHSPSSPAVTFSSLSCSTPGSSCFHTRLSICRV